MVLPAGADGWRERRRPAHVFGRAGLWPGLRIQVDRHLRRGRAGGAVPGRAVRPLAAGQAGLCPGVPHRIFGRCSVLCGDAAVHLHCILPAVLVARPQFWSGRLVAVPGLDVQLPLHAGGDPPV